MKAWRFNFAVALTWIMQDLRDFFAKLGRGTAALTGKVFGTPTREKRLRLSRIPFTRRRLHYLARLARVARPTGRVMAGVRRANSGHAADPLAKRANRLC